MRTNLLRSLPLFAGIALAPAAMGQNLGQSANYQLAAIAIDTSGGGSSSVGYSSWISLGDLQSDALASTNYKASVGFLPGNDPQPTNAPIVFGVTPDFGPKAGGTSFTLSGLNFDKFGTGGTDTVTIGGNGASRSVISNTQIDVTSPAGVHGPQDIVVSNTFGSHTVPGGFIYTPAITTTPVAPLLATFTMRNYGDVGNAYWTIASFSTTSANTKFGTLLIGGAQPLVTLFLNLPYPGPDGIDAFSTPVPNDSALHGVTIYFQSLSISGFGPLAGELTNRSQTFIP